MQPELAALEQASERAGALGARLFAACAGNIFPCDTLAASVLARTLNLNRGFKLLMEAKSYNCAAPLLRLQLDSLLRFYGVVTCRDPHGVALKVCQGTELRLIKHSNGWVMTDKNLQDAAAKTNPWIPQIYKQSSAYIHLSEQHFLHLLMQSTKDESGVRTVAVSDSDEYLPDEHKLALAQTFNRVTAGVLRLIEDWIVHRAEFTDAERLKRELSAV